MNDSTSRTPELNSVLLASWFQEVEDFLIRSYRSLLEKKKELGGQGSVKIYWRLIFLCWIRLHSDQMRSISFCSSSKCLQSCLLLSSEERGSLKAFAFTSSSLRYPPVQPENVRWLINSPLNQLQLLRRLGSNDHNELKKELKLCPIHKSWIEGEPFEQKHLRRKVNAIVEIRKVWTSDESHS